jgi:hypothetical protein
MIAFVREVIAGSISAGSMSMVSSLMSMKTGRAPDIEIASEVAIKVCATVITSSPLPMPNARRVR